MKQRDVMLTKDGQTYIFRYAAGQEDELLDEFGRLADARECELDWLDAAALSFEVARQTAVDCQQAIRQSPRQLKTS